MPMYVTVKTCGSAFRSGSPCGMFPTDFAASVGGHIMQRGEQAVSSEEARGKLARIPASPTFDASERNRNFRSVAPDYGAHVAAGLAGRHLAPGLAGLIVAALEAAAPAIEAPGAPV